MQNNSLLKQMAENWKRLHNDVCSSANVTHDFTGLEITKQEELRLLRILLSYCTEFAESKELVRNSGGDVFTSKLSDSEAKWLMEPAQSFYLNDVTYKLVDCFNKEACDFEFMDVLQALEMPIL